MRPKVMLAVGAAAVVLFFLWSRRASASTLSGAAPSPGSTPSRTYAPSTAAYTSAGTYLGAPAVTPQKSTTSGWFQPCPAGFSVNWQTWQCFDPAKVDIANAPPPPPPNAAELAANPEVRSGLGHF